MATSDWLDEVGQELLKGKSCAAYRERLLEELRDHVHDLRCEERNHAMSRRSMEQRNTRRAYGAPR